MSAKEKKAPAKPRRRTKKKKTPPAPKKEYDIVLLCNPQAGGRWRELADILDSDEARAVRRIVTDSIADIAPALSELGKGTQLVCIYGGDGTIQRILDQMFTTRRVAPPQVAFIGGGTMNVTARWCGMRPKPGDNFRGVIQAYQSGNLLLKEVPLLKVEQGDEVHFGFTFGMGPLVRILDAYENGSKGKPAALAIAAKSIAATWTGTPSDFQPVLAEMDAEILCGGEALPYNRWAGVFANTTGKVHIAVEPFVKSRTRDTFHHMSYSIDRRELAVLFPFLIRGRVPLDPTTLLTEVSTWKQIALSLIGKGSFPTDPRYFNDVQSELEVRSPERIYTVDGEVLKSNGEPIKVTLGPAIKLVVTPTVALGPTTRMAAEVTAKVAANVPGMRSK